MVPEDLRILFRLAGQKEVTPEEVAEKLGSVTDDFGSTLWVTPQNPAYSEVRITRTVDRKSLHSIHLTLAHPIPVDEFLREYPDADRYAGDDDAPNQYGVTVDTGDTPYLVKLFADTKLDTVTGYTVFRDVRL